MKNIMPRLNQTLLAICCALACSLTEIRAQVSNVNPVPQQIKGQGQLFQAPSAWNINAGKSLRESYVLKAIQGADTHPDGKAHFSLTIGTKRDKCVKDVRDRIPQRPEGYYLKISQDKAVIAGADERGAYYGVQTLLSIMHNGKLEACEITDYPDVRYRGVVEGFYGTPWSHEARMEQLKFYGRNKMNVYLYGPKDDPYHSVPNWRKPYPDKEAAHLKRLVQQAKDNGVIFYWAIHPGGDIKWNETDRTLLLKKFESMYNLGIRAFAVFFDDISGEGTKAEKQTELLNYIDEHFIQKKGDIAPLVMCPTEYNKAWSNDAGGYLKTLGSGLNKNIEIMWTGNSVVHCIDKPSLEWINARIDRKAYIWWNYPVSDFVRDHVLLGPVYGNGSDIANDMSAFVSNPMEHAEASKIALYSIADYTWNMRQYDSLASWKRAIKAILPGHAKALQIFASYNEDLGPNGHAFRREESRHLLPIMEALKKNPEDEVAILNLWKECSMLRQAVDILLNDQENPELIKEITPWLKEAKLAAEYGESVCLTALDIVIAKKKNVTMPETFKDYYDQIRSLQTQMYALQTVENQNPYQPGVKVGTRVLLPTLNALFTYAVNTYNNKAGTHYDATGEYQPYRLTSTVPQLANLPIVVRGTMANISPSNEVINWENNASLTITMEQAQALKEITFDLATPQTTSLFTLEIFVKGTWSKLPILPVGKGTICTTGLSAPSQAIDRIRLTNTSGKDLQIYFRSFKLYRQN